MADGIARRATWGSRLPSRGARSSGNCELKAIVCIIGGSAPGKGREGKEGSPGPSRSGRVGGEGPVKRSGVVSQNRKRVGGGMREVRQQALASARSVPRTPARCETGRSTSRHGRVRRGEKRNASRGGGAERNGQDLPLAILPRRWRQSKSSLNRVGQAAAKCTQGRPYPANGRRPCAEPPASGEPPDPRGASQNPQAPPSPPFEEGLRARGAPGGLYFAGAPLDGGLPSGPAWTGRGGIVTLRP